MIIIDIIASAAVAVLAGMGVGGGGLLVIYLTLLKGMDQLKAQGINLLFFIASALSAVIFNFKKRKPELNRLVKIALPGIAFAILGSLLAKGANPQLIRKCFGGLLVISGISGLLKSFAKKQSKK